MRVWIAIYINGDDDFGLVGRPHVERHPLELYLLGEGYIPAPEGEDFHYMTEDRYECVTILETEVVGA